MQLQDFILGSEVLVLFVILVIALSNYFLNSFHSVEETMSASITICLLVLCLVLLGALEVKRADIIADSQPKEIPHEYSKETPPVNPGFLSPDATAESRGLGTIY